MSRGRRTKANKQELFSQICSQINLPCQDSWKSTGSTITADGFQAVLEQTARNTGIPPAYFEEHEALAWRLVHKSIEAIVLALEVINKPSIGYRLEDFLFLFINAWELLLKARLVSAAKDTAAIQDRSDPSKTVTFAWALKENFPSNTDATRMNLSRIEDLRNNATHLFIDVVPPNVLLICQAGILNYARHLEEWFNRSLGDRIPLGMIFLVSEFDPRSFSLESPALSRRIPTDAIAYLRQWQDRVKADINSLADDQVGQYAIKIDLNLSLTNNQSKADILASFQPQAGDTAAVCIRFQRLIDKYQYSYTGLMAAIKAKRPGTKQSEVNAVIARCNIKDNPEFAAYNFRNREHEERYKRTKVLPTGTPVLYGIKAIDYIVSQLVPAAAQAVRAAQLPTVSVQPADPAPAS